jgi:hypothetical protein
MGPLHVLLLNRTHQGQNINAGERIAQLLILPIGTRPMKQVAKLSPTKRSQQGFGSTGVYLTQEVEPTYQLEPTLPASQQEELRTLINRFSDIFAIDYSKIAAKEPKYFHDIDTGDHPPIKQNPYRIPPGQLKEVRQELKKLLDNNIIRTSTSPWASPVVPIAKKDGTMRVCIDYRKVNAVTVGDGYPLPRIDDLLRMIPLGTRYHSSVDALSGYHLMGLTQRAIERSAFTTPDGQWEYLRMPFGLCNAPASFQRMMNGILGDLVATNEVLVYLDDVTVCSPTWPLHLKVLQKVFQRFRDHGIYLKPKKCAFALQEMAFLGHVINENGIHTNPDKIKAMLELPPPRNLSELRSALGLFGYYRSYVPNFSTLAGPLYQLTKKNTPFHWTDAHQKAYDALKKKMTEAPLLAKPNFDKPFRLYTDASAEGLGAILVQLDDQGKEQVIYYASRGTRQAEKSYGATKLEALAVVWACDFFRYYLIGKHFDVYTDHQALKWLMTMKTPSSLFQRWILKLQEYDMTIHYRPGQNNQNADALSRLVPRSPDNVGATQQ